MKSFKNKENFKESLNKPQVKRLLRLLFILIIAFLIFIITGVLPLPRVLQMIIRIIILVVEIAVLYQVSKKKDD